MKDLGTVQPGTTIYIEFDSFGASGESITISGLAVTDVEIYRDGSITQRASDNGYTLLDTDGIDLDGVTGIQGLSISLADNSDAGFYRAGSHYRVVIASVTINAQTVSFTAATFRIGYEAAVLNTTIATLSSQTSFTLTAGPAEDDALNGCWAVVHDVASAVQKSVVQILDYTGASKTVTLAAGATFTAAATDNISIMGPMPLAPTVTGRTLDVSAGGEAGVDWANIGSPTTTVNLSGTTVKTATDVETDTADIQSRLPAALTAGGNIKADALAWNGLTTVALPLVPTVAGRSLDVTAGGNAGIDWANVSGQTTLVDLSATTVGAVSAVNGSVAVGSIAAGAITAAVIADGAIDAAAFAADVDAEILSYLVDDATRIDASALNTAAATTIPAIAADNPNRPTRGVQFDNHVFTMVDATDFNTPETGVTVTATISKDGGAFAACTNAASEISGGFYKITLTATEMTCDVVALKLTGTGCAQRSFVWRNQPT